MEIVRVVVVLGLEIGEFVFDSTGENQHTCELEICINDNNEIDGMSWPRYVR